MGLFSKTVYCTFLYEMTSESNLTNVLAATGTMQILWSFVNKGFPYAVFAAESLFI